MSFKKNEESTIIIYLPYFYLVINFVSLYLIVFPNFSASMDIPDTRLRFHSHIITLRSGNHHDGCNPGIKCDLHMDLYMFMLVDLKGEDCTDNIQSCFSCRIKNHGLREFLQV